MMEVLRRNILSPHKDLSNYRLVCPAQEVMEKSLAGLALRNCGGEVGKRISILRDMLD